MMVINVLTIVTVALWLKTEILLYWGLALSPLLKILIQFRFSMAKKAAIDLSTAVACGTMTQDGDFTIPGAGIISLSYIFGIPANHDFTLVGTNNR